MSNIIAICNQKGGVGKTTTTMNLGAALAQNGKRVLLCDLDAQANLTEYLRFEDDGRPAMTDLFAEVAAKATVSPETVKNSIRHNEVNNVDYIPANINLANADVFLLNTLSRETVLKRILSAEITEAYDYILIDCLPSLGVLLLNALTAADAVLIPVQVQKFSLDGLEALTALIGQVQNTINPTLKLLGILPTMVDNTTVSKNALNMLSKDNLGKRFSTEIHRSVEAAKSSESGHFTFHQTNEEISVKQTQRNYLKFIMHTLNIKNSPTTKQKEYFLKWQTLALSDELVCYAYEKTYESIGKFNIVYMDKIMVSWAEAGYKTREDVDMNNKPVRKPPKCLKLDFAIADKYFTNGESAEEISDTIDKALEAYFAQE